MGRVIPFSELELYLDEVRNIPLYKGAILDTNILISASYELRDSYSEVSEILEILKGRDYQLFATVNTRAEYLEFRRRVILSENLLDAVDEFAKVKISQRAKAKIQTLKGSLKSSMIADPEKDEIFNDSQLKKIKKEFSAGPHSGQIGWLEFCSLYLNGKIEISDQELLDRGVIYISPNDRAYTDLFHYSVQWKSAIEICERAGTAFSDSMILNVLKSSKLPFIVTLDFDIGYAALSDPNIKDVVVPDKLYKEYKGFHF